MKAATNHNSADASTAPTGSKSTSKSHAKKQTSNKSSLSTSSTSTSSSKSKKNSSSSSATVPGATSNASAPTASNAGTAGQAAASGATESGSTNSLGAGNSSKDKNQSKPYAGFHAKSIKSIWEQFDRYDSEVHPEVLVRLAEDTTYKLWELGNSLKTYSRHSGGLVTVDGVNEVLKDSDVPPVIGAGGSHWDHVEQDGTFYFPFDEVLELRDEYLKEVNTTQCGTLRLAAGWKLDKKATPGLNAFSKALCIATITGDDETFEYATHIAAISSSVACVLRSILRFCLKMLMFEFTDESLDRVLKLVTAIVRNPYTRDCTMQEDQLYHLGQLMVCLVLGPLDLNIGMAEFKREQLEQKQREYEINSIAKELQLSVKEEVTSAVVNTLYPAMDVDDIQNECEALLQMMENEGFEPPVLDGSDVKTAKLEPGVLLVKQEVVHNDSPPFDDKPVKSEPTTFYSEEFAFNPNTDTSSSYPKSPKLLDDEISQETIIPDPSDPIADHINTNEDDSQTGDASDETPAETYSPLTTAKCTDARLEQVLTVIGGLSVKWGYFENEIVYLVSKRLEIFFLTVTEATMLDYDWLVRAIRLLWTLGDFAFRELTVYFAKIDTLQTPEWIQYYFNATAIFLRGRDDIFIYEYLYDLCGDGLSPFMVYFSKYSARHSLRLKRRRDANNQTALSARRRLLLRTIKPTNDQLPAVPTQTHRIADLFPHRVQPNLKKPHIDFSFAGCSPVVVRATSNSKTTGASPPTAISSTVPTTGGKCIVVCRRRLLRQRLDRVDDRADAYDLRRVCL